MAFDAYHKWLGVPPAEQPPHHYRLLGIALFEGDCDVIEGAADRQMAHVRTFQSGQHLALSQQILNELAAAKLCLLSPQKKAAYDADLRRRIGAAARPRAVGARLQNAAVAPVAVADCLDATSLSDFALGKLAAPAAEQISRHLAVCTDCRQKVADVSGDGFVDLLRAAVVAPEQANPGRTFVDRDAADGLETTVDHAKPPPRGIGRKPRSATRSHPELRDHPDYEIVKELGHGGMGVVYLARNRLMDRLEVLKVLKQSLLERPGALERFQQEIRSAAKLSHINIVAAYAVLRMGDSLVFAMEYVPGQDLAQVVARRGALHVPNATYYAHQAALGLQHAHEKGMVHRDIKPNNLMLTVDGKKHIVKILDFGLAKATSEKDGETGLTKSGQILGTPDYLAPEQSRDAQHADIRADIYSLGCTLYFLLSGKRPFPESSLYDVLDAHQRREATPLDQVRSEVPAELAAVVAKMMAKSPADRYQTPIEVAKALVPFFKPGQSLTPPVKPRDDEYPQYTMETAAAMEQPAAREPIAAPAALPLSPPRAVPFAVPLSKTAFDTSIDFESPLIDTDYDLAPPSRRWRLYVATCLAPLLLMLGIAIVVRTPRGTIQIELSNPSADVEVAIDGNRIDIAGLDEPVSLEVGDHNFKVTGKGYETITDKFTVTKGPNAPLVITLQSEKPSPKTEGTIEIVLSDPSAKVVASVDGNSINLAGRYELLSLNVGEHELKVTGEGYQTISKKFVVAEGQNDPLTVLLKPIKADLKPLAPVIEPVPAVVAAPPPAIAPFDAKQARAHQEGWAKHLGVTVEQTNSIGMKLTLIPPGEFTMGSTPEQLGAAKKLAEEAGSKPDAWTLGQLQAELPAHRVTITRPYLLAATETTVAQYRRFVDTTSYVTETERFGGGYSSSKEETDPYKHKLSWRSPDFSVQDDSAVSQITWNDAVAFCNWLSEAEQKGPCYKHDDKDAWVWSPDGDGYRLPTEAEWEHACRAGTTSQYSFSNTPTDLSQFGGAVNTRRTVATKKPNPFGLYDMHGNIEEWCYDWFRFDYYTSSPAADPFGPSTSDSRVVRGGVWDAQRQAVLWGRSTFRRSYLPPTRMSDLGFRVLRVATFGAGLSSAGSPDNPDPATTAPQSVADKLKKKVTLSFPRNTLEQSLKLLGDDIGVEIVILGNDLRQEGITKNQSFTLDERDQLAGDVLQKILKLANPDGKLVYVIKPKPGTSDGVLYITTRSALSERGDQLPPDLDGTAARGMRSGWSQLIAASTIEDEVKSLVAPIASVTKSPSAFKGGGNHAARVHFTELAMLFGVVAQYDGDVRWKKNAFGLRDIYKRAGVNCKVGTDNSYKEAKQRGDDLAQLITGGKVDLPRPDPNAKWADIANRPPLMARMGKEGYDPKVKAWTSDKGEFSKNRNALLEEAQIVALIARIIQDPSYEYGDDETYVGYAKDLEKVALELVEAVRGDSLGRAHAAAGALNKACSTCHEGYRSGGNASQTALKGTPAATEDPGFQQWLQQVATMSAKAQVEAVTKKLHERNPGFNGKLTQKIEGGVVTAVSFSCTNVTDISPVSALTSLRSLTCSNNTSKRAPLEDLTPLKHLSLSQFVGWNTSIRDLSPLKDMPLTSLTLTWSEVSDLSPLTGMRLVHLQLQSTKVSDLTPLKGMPLQHLDVLGTKVVGLFPLAGMPLTTLQCANTSISDLAPLTGLRLTSLTCGFTKISDLSPLAGMPLSFLSCDNTNVADLSPLKGMPLSTLNCDFQLERDRDVLSSIKTLTRLNGRRRK
jgi:serine/threonine protein kinase/formylglycine-generating enzyme required for sulfatase activity